MQVLKFGGTSVASAENIEQTLAIVARALAAGPVAVVVSALGGTTDALIAAGQAAAGGDDGYQHTLRQLEARHLTAAEQLLPDPASQQEIQPWLTAQFAELAGLAAGIRALGGLSAQVAGRPRARQAAATSRLLSSSP